MPIAEYHPCTVSQNNERYEKTVAAIRGIPAIPTSCFMSQLSAEEMWCLSGKAVLSFRGFYIQRRTIRQYSYNAAAHALGDIGEVSAKENGSG